MKGCGKYDSYFPFLYVVIAMKKGIYIIILSLILILSVNFISAAELTNASLELTSSDSLDNSDDLISISDSDKIDQLTDDNSDSSESENLKIYVGQNKTDNGGDGSPENPFSTLNLACDYANTQNKTQVTLNIYNGTYYLDSHLKFNTSNLVINGIGSPIIKNYYKEENTVMAFGLVSSSSKYMISNIVYDSSDVSKFVSVFSLFYGEASYGEFNNCSFVSYNSDVYGVPIRVPGGSYSTKFNNCYFYQIQSNNIFDTEFIYDKNTNFVTEFENCSFDLPNVVSLLRGQQYKKPTPTVNMKNCWLGKNTFPTFINPPSGYIKNSRGAWITTWTITVDGYALFSIYENYLGNNQYEIIGKLTWDTENNDASMENFKPMNVSLSSNTGEIQSNAILTNGVFRAIYTSNLTEHSVVAILGSEIQEINFKHVDMTIEAPSIYYGDDQNITINFSQPITANAKVIIKGMPYDLTVENADSITYIIPDTLTEGNYTVDVILSDVEHHVWGSNSTCLSVSKVSNYLFNVIPTAEGKVGENAAILIYLPEDVDGNVTIKFGNDTKILPANQTMTVDFTNLNTTTYDVTVTYSGSDKYVPNEKTDSITVDKGDSSVKVQDIAFTYGEVIVIPFTTTNANGVNVRVLNKDGDEVSNTTSEGTEFTLETLSAGEYTLEVTTIVDEKIYYDFTADDITLTINKAESGLTLNDSYEFIYGENVVINVVTENSTGDVIATLTDENNTEIAVTVSGDNITLPKLNTGKHTLTVTTNPDENHTNITKTATITINKATPSMNILVEPVENITTKDDVTLTISLPSDATGEVTVKINGKKVDTISANETITINLNNQAGDYVVDITYSGDKNYESDMATQEYKVSKAKTSITANPIIFEEGNTSTIEINIPDVVSGFILVDVEGKKFYGDINSGKATVLIDGLVAGNYTANIIFAGDEEFNKTTGTVAVNVTPTVDIISELNEIIKELNSTIESQAKEISNLTDTVAIQNSTIESQAKEISNLNTTVNNQTSTIESQKEQISNLNKQVDKKDVVLIVDQTFTRVAVDYNAGERGEMFYAILKNSEGNTLANKTVQIAINGKIYNKTTDNEGKAGIQVNLANANTYSYAVSFQGDDQYNAAPIAVSKLTVTKKKTTIKASNKVFKAKTKTKKISITLKTVKNQYDKKTYLKSGKKVTLKVNGKTYTAKINKKGVAKFTINITKKGKYAAKIKFAGDKTYKASSKTIKIRIK